MKVRTRIAPSPTGEFHIGGMRTLLYNWALAKKNNGQFVIRIEDTDRTRFVEGAMERFLQVVGDYGLSWDEGPEIGGPHAPYVQSERLDIYKKHAQKLVEDGKAYYCFCTSERLEKVRSAQRAKKIASPKYDRHCLSLSPEEIEEKLKNQKPYVIRLKVPDNQDISWEDGVLGKVRFNSKELDDQILLKSDGFPTYHLAVVVDDHEMEITHIMRGNEWLPSTPKHLLLYQAFGWDAPVIAHLPNLKELGGTKKLSKRFGPVAALGFLQEGYLPEAILNYLMFLGWNPGGEKEIYSLDEFAASFSLEKVHKTDLVSFDRDKLIWMNSQYIQSLDQDELARRIDEFYDHKYDLDLVRQIVPLINTRIKLLREFSEIAKFFFETPKVGESDFKTEDYRKHLVSAYKALESIDNWDLEDINSGLMATIEKEGFKVGKFFMDLRLAITGTKVTPPINESLVVLGKKETLARLSKLID